MLWPLLCLPTLVLDLTLNLADSIRGEREQAALLPSADDPEAVRQAVQDTGKIYRQAVHPLEGSRETADPPFLA